MAPGLQSFHGRIVLGITGASGSVYGIRLLEVLSGFRGIEIHLVISDAGKRTIGIETDRSLPELTRLAHFVHADDDISASIASGSFQTAGMIIAPCSMRSLGEIAHSLPGRLLTRAADVHLKERRPLILLVRETPLHLGHLRNLVLAAENGAVILPPVPAFYHRPQTVADLVNHSVGKALDMLSIPHELFRRWDSPSENR
jgi:flavin prenyltransferase